MKAKYIIKFPNDEEVCFTYDEMNELLIAGNETPSTLEQAYTMKEKIRTEAFGCLKRSINMLCESVQ